MPGDPRWIMKPIDREARWAAGGSGFIGDAGYWREKAEMLEQKYAALFPVGEAPGRIVMLMWDGQAWIRLPDKKVEGPSPRTAAIATAFKEAPSDSLIKALREEEDWKTEYLELKALVKKAEGQQWSSREVQALFRMVQGPSAEPIKIERVRRNNVVT